MRTRKKKKKTKRKLTIFQKHQLSIAKKTLKMPNAMVGVMGGMTKAEARRIKNRLEKRME